MSQLALPIGFCGAYIASGPGAPCHLCGCAIRAGERVFYAGERLLDEWRTCADCRALFANTNLSIGATS